MIIDLPVEDIQLDPDHFYRKTVTNIDELAESMAGPNGQLQPICVDEQNRLIFGFRRLEAAKRLKWPSIRAIRVDLSDPLAAIRDENECRTDLTVSERVELGQIIQAAEAVKGRERMTLGRNLAKGTERGRSAERAAEAVGWSRETYEAAKKVQQQGTEALKQAVDDQVISVSDAAKLSSQSAKIQDAAVADAAKPKGKGSARKKTLGPKKKAEAAFGVIVRYLDKHGLYEKYKSALEAMRKEISRT
jgi:ParB/RepB/Spo0J family partition protein